jgi:hypothetical protein
MGSVSVSVTLTLTEKQEQLNTQRKSKICGRVKALFLSHISILLHEVPGRKLAVPSITWKMLANRMPGLLELELMEKINNNFKKIAKALEDNKEHKKIHFLRFQVCFLS